MVETTYIATYGVSKLSPLFLAVLSRRAPGVEGRMTRREHVSSGIPSLSFYPPRRATLLKRTRHRELIILSARNPLFHKPRCRSTRLMTKRGPLTRLIEDCPSQSCVTSTLIVVSASVDSITIIHLCPSAHSVVRSISTMRQPQPPHIINNQPR